MADAHGLPPVSKILVPVDQSPRDGVVLPYCVRLAQPLSATLAILSVVSLTKTFFPNAIRLAEAYLTATELGLREQGVATQTIVRRGDPSSVIVALADEVGADLIVMATRGRRGVDKLFMGSVADAVLTASQRPVLLLNENAKLVQSSEETRLESAYVATVVWNKRARGLLTEEEATRDLERLAIAGLDRGVLFATYVAQDEGQSPLPWLDIDFQVSTLRRFLPAEASAVEAVGDRAFANDETRAA